MIKIIMTSCVSQSLLCGSCLNVFRGTVESMFIFRIVIMTENGRDAGGGDAMVEGASAEPKVQRSLWCW